MKNFKRFVLSMLVFLCVTMSAPIISHAEAEVNLAVDECTGGSSYYKNGVSASRSFYLCYLLDTRGNAITGTNAVLLRSEGASVISGSVFKCSSRKGGYSASRISDTAPWKVTPFNSDSSSNAEVIRTWLKSKTEDPAGIASNAYTFVSDCWGDSCAKKFEQEEIILVIETAFNFQPSYSYIYSVKPETLIHVPEPYKSAMLAKNGETYHRPFGNAVVGTVPNLIRYMQSNYEEQTAKYSAINFLPIERNNPFKSYTNGVMPQAEKIAFDLCGFRAYTGSDTLSNDDVAYYGVGMMLVTASDVPVVSTEEPAHTGGYEGYFFSLSCSGINGSYNANATFDGGFYADSSASGTDAYALAESYSKPSSGMSFLGDVPSVVYTGTNFDMSLESNASIRTGCVTLDASTFYGISDIHTTTESNYQSFANSVRSGITRGIDLKTFDGSNSRATYSYDDSSWESSGFLGGDFTSQTYPLQKWATLTETNSKTTGTAPAWQEEAVYNVMLKALANMYYNRNVSTANDGLGIWSDTDLARAYNDSTTKYLAEVKRNGTLLRYWTSRMETDRNNKSSSAGNTAKRQALANYDSTHPEPEVGEEPVRGSMTRAEFERLHDAWKDAKELHDDWESERARVGTDAYNTAYSNRVTEYNNNDIHSYTCNWYTGSQGGKYWKVIMYSQSPYYENGYLVSDKVPLRSGPSASAGKYFQKAYKAQFFYTLRTSGVSDTSHLITYLPFASRGYTSTTVGSLTNVEFLCNGIHISNADFLISDVTSADMKSN